MSTDFTLTISATDGSMGTIKIIDSINPLPGSDSWEASDKAQWDTDGGPVTSWGSGGTYLSGPLGVQSIFLDGFTKSTVVGDQGSGQKNYDEGTFPSGGFTWRCTKRD